jgi:uncharacterized membrane protein (DUF4010 family)
MKLYRGNQAPLAGLTTEFALLATFAVGFLAIENAPLAAASGVLLTLLVSSKSRLHRFATTQLSEQELHDATLLAGAALIILPLLPNAPVDPLAWSFAAMLAISANVISKMTMAAVGGGRRNYQGCQLFKSPRMMWRCATQSHLR